MQIEDYKDENRKMRQRLHQAETVAQERLERANYWQSVSEQKEVQAEQVREKLADNKIDKYQEIIDRLDA